MKPGEGNMGSVKLLMVIVAVLLVISFWGGKPGLCAVNCADLPGMISDQGLTGPLTAEVKPAAGGMAEYCEVRGVLALEIKFAVKFPSAWNERFYMAGEEGSTE